MVHLGIPALVPNIQELLKQEPILSQARVCAAKSGVDQ